MSCSLHAVFIHCRLGLAQARQFGDSFVQHPPGHLIDVHFTPLPVKHLLAELHDPAAFTTAEILEDILHYVHVHRRSLLPRKRRLDPELIFAATSAGIHFQTECFYHTSPVRRFPYLRQLLTGNRHPGLHDRFCSRRRRLFHTRRVLIPEGFIVCAGSNERMLLDELFVPIRGNLLVFLDHIFHKPLNGLIAPQFRGNRYLCSSFHVTGFILTDKVHYPIHTPLAGSPFFCKPVFAKFPGTGPYLLSTFQQAVCLPGRIENPVLRFHGHGTRMPALRVATNHLHSQKVEYFDFIIVDSYRNFAVQRGRESGIIRIVHLDSPVIVYGSDTRTKIAKWNQRQFVQIRLLCLIHLFNLAFGTAVNPFRGPVLLPVHQPFVLRFDALKGPTFQSRVLGMFNAIFHGSFSIRVTYSCRIPHHVIVVKHRSIQRVEQRFINIRLEDSFFQIVRHNVFRATSKITESFFMQPGPRFLARLPYCLTKGPPGIPQRHDKQARSTILSTLVLRPGALAIINLGLLSREKLQAVKLLWIMTLQPTDKSLHAVVPVRKSKKLNQILINRHGISTKPYLHLYPLTMRLARRTGMSRNLLSCTGRTRWPGWGILTG